MANQFRLVSDIILDAQYRADIQGQDDRHPAANLLRLFNESAQQLRVRKANLGFEGYFKRAANATLSLTAAATGETYSEQDWPVDACNIYGVHVLFETNLWIALKPVSISGIRDYQRNGVWEQAFRRGNPAVFALREAPLGVTTVETAGKICIAPLPTVARTYTVIYLQNWSDAASTDKFNGFAGDIEWVIWDMVAKISARDNDSNKTHDIAMVERDRIEKVFASAVPRIQMGTSIEPRRADDYGYDEFAIHELR